MANILIVDDEREIVTLMKLILERQGHKITEAFNGEQALQVLGVEPVDAGAVLPDIMILDIMMPIVDGFTVATAMQYSAHAAKVPILVVSAKSDMRQPFTQIPAVAGFFGKPFNPKVLVETVAKLLAP